MKPQRLPHETERALRGHKAAPGSALVWDGARWVPGAAVSPVLYVSDLADGPPTDGSVFWYVTDESC